MHKRTIWSIVATVAIVLMVSAMLPISTAQGPLTNTTKGAQPANDQFGLFTNGTANTSYEQSNLVRVVGQLTNPLIGAFNQSGNNVTGSYVSFNVDNSTGSLMNYSLMSGAGSNVMLLNSVQVSGLKLGGATIKGPLYMVSNGSFGMAIHDNPEGTMHMASTDGGNVTMTLASGATVSQMQSSAENMKAWQISVNGATCVLMVWNGTVSQGAQKQTSNQTMTTNNTTQSTMTPTSGNVTTQPVCSIKMANATSTSNMTNMTGATSTPSGTKLTIALNKSSFVVLRAIPTEPGFSPADEQAIANAIVNGEVNTEMSIQSMMITAVKVTGNATGNVTTGNQTANVTATKNLNVTSQSIFGTMWYTVEYFDFSTTKVTSATQGNVTISITPTAGNATKSTSNVTQAIKNATGNLTANKTAGNQTANATASNQTANATAAMPHLWVISVNDLTLGAGNKIANVSLDGKRLSPAGSMSALTSNPGTDAYFMAPGTNANKFIVSIADPSVYHTLQISTLTGAVLSSVTGTTTGNTTTSNATTGKMASSAGASGAGAVEIGVIGLAGIAACVFVVRRKK